MLPEGGAEVLRVVTKADTFGDLVHGELRKGSKELTRALHPYLAKVVAETLAGLSPEDSTEIVGVGVDIARGDPLQRQTAFTVPLTNRFLTAFTLRRAGDCRR